MNVTKMIKSFTKYLFLFLIFSSSLYAQYQTEWISKYAGVDLTSSLVDMKSDSMGNVYICLWDTGYTTIKYSTSGQLLWKRHWSLGYVIQSVTKAMALDREGNIFVTGSDYGITTIKYDPNGNVVWNRRYYVGGQMGVRDIKVDSSGNAIIGVGHGFMGDNLCMSFIKYSPQGDTVWIRKINKEGYRGGAVFQFSLDKNGNIYAIGQLTSISLQTFYYLLKIDSNGNLKWLKILNNQRRMFKLDIDGDNNIIIGGESDSTFLVMRIEKFDSNGNNLWRTEYFDKEFGYSFLYDLKVDEDGYIYIAGSDKFLTMLLNSNGEIEWVKNEIWGNTSPDIAYSITFDKNKNVYTTGALAIVDSIKNYETYKFYSVKYSLNGNKLWESEYWNRFWKKSSAGKIILDKFNNIIVSGSSREFTENYFANVTIKYSIPISINNENEILSEYKLYQNYPNPFNSQTKIKYNLPKNESKVEIKIYDIKGQEIMVMREYNKEAGSYEMNLDLSSQSSGIYFIKLSTEKFSDTKKLVLIR